LPPTAALTAVGRIGFATAFAVVAAMNEILT
jgi:hypothetical protein